MPIQEQTKLLEALIDLASAQKREDFREKAWEHFLAAGLPQKQEEAFRYLSLKELYGQEFYTPPSPYKEIHLPELQKSPRFVLINGCLSKKHSSYDTLPKEVVFCTLKEAERQYSFLLRHKAEKVLQEDSRFSLLNYALYEEGFFLYVPPKIHLEEPIEIFDLVSSDVPTLSFPKISLYVGKEAQVNIHLHTHTQGERHFINRAIEVHLEPLSHSHIRSHALDIGNCWYFDQVAFSLKRDATCHYLGGDFGGELLRQEFRVELLEENGEMRLEGLSLLQEKKQTHHYVQMRHLAPACRSFQHFKGVLFDRAHLSFEGKIFVDQCAQKTEAYQLSNQLILGERACGYSKPHLEIFADDVKASHGATVAQLKADEMFYLQARGLSPRVAKNILIKGFCAELMEKMTFVMKEKMTRYLYQKLER